MAASGINFADVMARMGLYPDAPKTLCVVGQKFAGTVLELGEGVQGLNHGQRVFADEVRGYASQVVVPAAATSWRCLSGSASSTGRRSRSTTAWAAPIGYGSLQSGERVLIHSVGGGVGIAATQIAKRQGAEVAAHPRASTRASAGARLRPRARLHEPRGGERGLPDSIDVILDAVGGKSFRRDYSLLRAGGLVAFGASGVVSGERRNPVAALRTVLRMPRFNLLKQMSEWKTVIGLNMLSLWQDRKTLDRAADRAARRRHDRTRGRRRVCLRASGRGAEHDHERRNIGKVVLTP